MGLFMFSLVDAFVQFVLKLNFVIWLWFWCSLGSCFMMVLYLVRACGFNAYKVVAVDSENALTVTGYSVLVGVSYAYIAVVSDDVQSYRTVKLELVKIKVQFFVLLEVMVVALLVNCG